LFELGLKVLKKTGAFVSELAMGLVSGIGRFLRVMELATVYACPPSQYPKKWSPDKA